MASTTASIAADVSVTNTDNDASGITVSTISGAHDGSRRHRDLHRRAERQPTADVTVGLSTSDATEGTVRPRR